MSNSEIAYRPFVRVDIGWTNEGVRTAVSTLTIDIRPVHA